MKLAPKNLIKQKEEYTVKSNYECNRGFNYLAGCRFRMFQCCKKRRSNRSDIWKNIKKI